MHLRNLPLDVRSATVILLLFGACYGPEWSLFPQPIGGEGDDTAGSTTGVTGEAGSASAGETGAGPGDDGSSTGTGDAPPACGDGVREDPEECDQGPANSDLGACSGDCRINVCGDGLVGPGEGCDQADLPDWCGPAG